MIKGNSNLHVLVLSIRITVAQEHDLIMMGHVVVRDGDGCGSMDGIDQSIVAVRQRAMVNPNVLTSKDGHPIAVRYSPPPGMLRRVSDIAIASLLTVMYVNAMNDDVGGIMNGYAWSISNVNTCTSTINSLERVHDQLLLQLNHHVSFEYNPQWLILYHSMPESSRLRIHRVIVAGIRDDINPTVSSPNSILPKSNGAISQPLTVCLPVRVTPPAVVNRIPSST